MCVTFDGSTRRVGLLHEGPGGPLEDLEAFLPPQPTPAGLPPATDSASDTTGNPLLPAQWIPLTRGCVVLGQLLDRM